MLGTGLDQEAPFRLFEYGATKNYVPCMHFLGNTKFHHDSCNLGIASSSSHIRCHFINSTNASARVTRLLK